MKENRISRVVRTLLVLTLAFAFAFAPYVADQASAGTAVIDDTFSNEQVLQKYGETVFYRDYFTIESDSLTYNVNVVAAVTGGTAIDSSALQIQVIEQNTNTVMNPVSPGCWTINQPGYYAVKVVAPAGLNFPSSPIPRVQVEGTVLVETEGMPQYDFFKVETSDVTGEYADDINFTLMAGAANYQGSGDLGRLFYAKDHYTGKFIYMGELTSVATEANRVSYSTAQRGKTYTVYVVNRNIAQDNKSEVPLPIGGAGGTTSDVFTLTADQEAKLNEISQFETISTPPPTVGAIKSLSNTKAVTLAKLKWTVVPKDGDKAPNITGYKVKRYSTSGKLLKTTTVTKLKDNSNRFNFKPTFEGYTPYKGKSVYKVTPYFKYLGKTYYGDTKSITVQSKQLTATATDGNAVKITNNKAGYTVNAEYGATGVGIFQKKGSKWVLVKKSKINQSRGWIYLTVSKTGIGKKNVKFKSYVVDGGKTYWSPITSKTKLIKPRKNQVTIGTPSNIGAYPWLEVTKVRTKIWYEGNDMYVKYRVVNRDSKKKIAVQTTVVVENLYSGKFTTVGKSNKKYITLSYGKMGYVTVKIKNAKKVDLINSIVR